jgi:hypothetical protein
MLEASFPEIAAWGSALAFAVAGLVNATAVPAVRKVYADWDIPARFYRTLGVVEIAAAACLMTPEFRLVGIALAGPIMFGSIVLLLDRQRYVYAVPAILMMVALIPAALAIPSRTSIAYVADVSAPAAVAVHAEVAER